MEADRRSIVRSPTLALLLPALALAALGTGCSRVAVHSLADPSAQFGTYASFEFLPRGGLKEDPQDVPRRLRVMRDPLYHAYVQEAATEELRKRGFVLAPSRDEADLLIGYRTVVSDRADVLPPVYGVGWYGHAYVARPAHVQWYKEGTLVIDIVDRRGRQLLWRGVGVGAMRDMRPGKDLKAAVREILAKFPPDD